MRKVPNANVNLFLNTRYSRQAARRRATCRQNTSARNRPRSNSTRACGTIYQQKPINNTAEINDAGVLLGLATRKVTISRRRPATSSPTPTSAAPAPGGTSSTLSSSPPASPPGAPPGALPEAPPEVDTALALVLVLALVVALALVLALVLNSFQ